MPNFRIENATIIDGTGKPARIGTVEVTGDQISAIQFRDDPSSSFAVPVEGNISSVGSRLPEQSVDSSAVHTIDATGQLLCPGFIDPHASTGYGFFFPRAADHKLMQGVTTEIFGNCGFSPAPIGDGLKDEMQQLAEEIGFPWDWTNLSEFFDRVDGRLGMNIATLVGHSTLRSGVGADGPGITRAQLDEMKIQLEQSMQHGALGLSTGLIYAPGCFADTEELVELATVAAKNEGVYATHLRSERDKLLEAADEAIEIGRRSGVTVLISHLKAAERRNWGNVQHVLQKIADADKSGLTVAADVYPYTAVSTKLHAFVPKDWLSGGIDQLKRHVDAPMAVDELAQHVSNLGYDLSRMRLLGLDPATFCDSVRDVDDLPAGDAEQTICDWAKRMDVKPEQIVLDVLRENPVAWIVYDCLDQNDVDMVVTDSETMICTDSWSYPINAPQTPGRPHPRSYAAFTKYLEDYTVKTNRIDWPKAIEKITSRPAAWFGLNDRGEIAVGKKADLVLLAEEAIRAKATFDNPQQLSEGVQHLWVNGVHSIIDGQIVPINGGKILR